MRRIATGIVAVAIVLCVGIGAGLLAFRGLVGSNMALKDSNAQEALVPAKSNEPSYTLMSIDIGAIAKPLELDGPDTLILAYVNPSSQKLALINIPGSLQVVEENRSINVSSLAQRDDASLNNAIKTYSKVDIAHFVKLDSDGLVGIADALGGITLDVNQVIDDPHAGTTYLPAGSATLQGEALLTYLRADNLKMGMQDKMSNQLDCFSQIIADIFMSGGAFQTKLESIDSFFQTDCTLADFDELSSWLSKQQKSDILTVNLPGYLTSVTGVTDDSSQRYIATSDEMAEVIQAIESGEAPASISESSKTADPASFTVEVQNGTTISGAASITGDLLKSKGFNVVTVGNAEQQIYEETLIVYQDDAKRASAQTVLDALNLGRVVDGGGYYKMETDVLVVIGSDYVPTS